MAKKKKPKKKLGGRRKGAGRKPLYGEPQVQVSIKLPESLLERVNKYCYEKDIYRSRLFVELLQTHMK